MASFENPVIPSYTETGKLSVANNGAIIDYAIVYELTEDGKRFIWGVDSLSTLKPTVFKPNGTVIADDNWKKTYYAGFVNALKDAGLYEDEAAAMLNTWEESYFNKPGIKVFWIVPRVFTDSILPIQFSQTVSGLERVMMGRT
ncbi:MAG: hypothetical protein ACI9UJ_001813 [bacterium]